MTGLPDSLLHLDLPELVKVRSGKVREVFDLGPDLLFVATDRISAFDCILPNGIPGKGKILSQLSAWWFRRFASILPHHLVEDNPDYFPDLLSPYRELLRGRAMIVKKTSVIPIECVARGYLIGSAWSEARSSGHICGIPLPPGIQLADPLPEPIFTPAAKIDDGHDQNIPFDQVADRVGLDLARKLRETTLELYRVAAQHAQTLGLILADTKFEFGLDENGNLVWIDEALTPDSSRYWPADLVVSGQSPPSYDKQIVRDYLASLAWDKTPPAPVLPPPVIQQTRARYLDLFRILTGRIPEAW
ncbi:MAG TPA: phosphoribosylaminoimidazolesuccinocarboxamide synthase [Kiritimatiellia bacterium]|nr:phosphoribosylaminoimidazolesuccinocarboxamide synthase [Kiritimatiellia bacterium]